MATYTPNLGLTLPDYNEDADISIFNENMRLIDAKLALATASVAGLVMPDNETITVNQGVLTVVGGSGGGSGTGNDTIATNEEISDITNGEGGDSESGTTPDISSIGDATAYTKGISRPDNTTIFVENGVLSAKQYTLNPATANTLGGIKVGENLQITQDGVLSATDTIYELPRASSSVLGGVRIDNESIKMDEYGFIHVDFTDLALPVATDNTLGIVRAGDNVTIDEDGYLSVDFPQSYTLPIATLSILGGVIPDGQTILINDRGVISVPFADDSSYGLVRPDNTSIVIENGVISTIDSSYELPMASNNTLGGVMVDNETITIDATGTISSVFSYELPMATESTLGGIIVDGETLQIDENGVLSTTFSDFSITMATHDRLGGVKIDNDTITIDDEGHISANTKIASTTTLGSVMVDGRTIVVDALGTLSVRTAYVLPAATKSALGGVRVDSDISPIYLTENNVLALNILEDSGLKIIYDEDLGMTITHDSGSGVMTAAGYQDAANLMLGGQLIFPYIIFDQYGHEKSVRNRSLTLPALSSTFRQELEQDGSYTVHLNPASNSVLGGIIASENSFTISGAGVLDVKETTNSMIDDIIGTTVINPDGTIGSMPIATADVIGGIKIGDNLIITGDGRVSVNKDMVSATSVYESGIELGSITINGETVTFYIPDYEYADGMEF